MQQWIVGLVLGSLLAGAGEAAAGDFYARIRANDAPIGGRFSIYVYLTDSLDAVVEMPGPGRVLAVNLRESNGKDSFFVPQDLRLLARGSTWTRGFLPLETGSFEGLLPDSASWWGLWWIPSERGEEFPWADESDLRLQYGFAESPFVPMKPSDARATNRALPWDRIRGARIPADGRMDVPVRSPDPASFDEPPRVKTRVDPMYPRDARAYDFEGIVHVVAVVDHEGLVRDAYVVHTNAQHLLNVAALVSVMDWTFQPGKKDGRWVTGDMIIPVRFALGTVR